MILPEQRMTRLVLHRCTYSASCMFTQIVHDPDQKWLIRYPVFLLYSTFALITVF
jgi:hypothetical protein